MKEYEFVIDRRSYTHNLSSCEIKAWKKFRPERDLNPWPLRYGAVLYRLSYQAICELVTGDKVAKWPAPRWSVINLDLSPQFKYMIFEFIYSFAILTLVVSGTFLSIQSPRANLKQNLGTFLAFLCFSNKNTWYVSKWKSKGPGVEFKVRGYGSYRFHVNSTVIQECNFPRHI